MSEVSGAGSRTVTRRDRLCSRGSGLVAALSIVVAAAIALGWPASPGGNPAMATPAAGALDDARICDHHGALVEQALQLPDGLLRAIGRVESGRRDPVRGSVSAWPWTLNANGQGRFFADLGGAVEAVRGLQSRGVSSIDTGCFQVNLQHHPHAFRTLDEAFDPAANAAYAGAFLRSLKLRLGTWEAAIAAYHSASPQYGEPYRARVLAAWRGHQPGMLIGMPAPPRVAPVVVRISGPDLSGPESTIRVWTPSRTGSAPSRVALPLAATVPIALQSTVAPQPVIEPGNLAAN